MTLMMDLQHNGGAFLIIAKENLNTLYEGQRSRQTVGSIPE
jgi:hypothetical protein